jgi:hypothetical protein
MAFRILTLLDSDGQFVARIEVLKNERSKGRRTRRYYSMYAGDGEVVWMEG